MYVYLSGILKDKNNWEESLKEILSKIDWDIKNYPYKDITTSKNKLIKTTEMFINNLIGGDNGV